MNYTQDQIYELLGQLDDEEMNELQQDMGAEMAPPGARYDMGGGIPIPNPIDEAKPQAGEMQMQAQNPALRRLYAQMPKTQGKPIIPGLEDHSNQFQSDHNWHASGGV